MYEGQWLNGKQHGKGKMTSPSGVSKSGEWENGKRIKWDTPLTGDEKVFQSTMIKSTGLE